MKITTAITLLILHSFFYTYAQHNNYRYATSDTAYFHKLSPVLRNTIYTLPSSATWLLSVSDTTAFTLFVQQHTDSIYIKKKISQYGIYVASSTVSFITQKVLPLPFLRFADSHRKTPQEEGAIRNYNMAFNRIQKTHATWPFLSGTGLTISVKEQLFDTSDIDFHERIAYTDIAAASVSSHAGVMATIIAGAGNSYYTGTGAAPGATLSGADYNNLLPDEDAYSRYHITVQNHSYGVGIENYYGADAAAYDAGTWRDSVLIHVFSAGNSGTDTAEGSPYNGLPACANSTGSFKMAKNGITVGAVDAQFEVPAASSRGPACDGRLFPQLVAYGDEGSSGAAALVSGSVLVLQDAWRQTHAGKLPPAAMVKAALLNSTTDLLQPGPDYTSGYGVLNTFKAVRSILNHQYLQGVAFAKQTDTFSLYVPEGVQNLRITLAWNDTAAAPNATTALVNDLDLALLTPTGNQRFLPLVLHHTAHKDSLQLPASPARDSLNVAEQIVVDKTEAGPYKILVTGYKVSGRQPFSIVWQWDTLQQFTWLSPAAHDYWSPEAQQYFIWEYHGKESAGELAVQYTGDKEWQIIEPAAVLNAPYFSWPLPDTFTTAVARMRIGEKLFYSDTFALGYQHYPAVGFRCADSLLLYWPQKAGAARYKVFRLQGKQMEEIQEAATKEHIVLHSATSASPFYAVAPVAANGYTGGKSYAIDVRNQAVGCYFYGLTADLLPSENATVTARLGSLYQIKSIAFEKRYGNNWIPLYSRAVTADNLQYNITDSALFSGTNTYRCRLITTEGKSIYSEPAALYYWKNNDDYLLFPNPLHAGETLQLLSKNPFNKSVTLFTMQGRRVFTQSISNQMEILPIPALPAGMYILTIQEEGKHTATRRLIITGSR